MYLKKSHEMGGSWAVAYSKRARRPASRSKVNHPGGNKRVRVLRSIIQMAVDSSVVAVMDRLKKDADKEGRYNSSMDPVITNIKEDFGCINLNTYNSIILSGSDYEKLAQLLFYENGGAASDAYRLVTYMYSGVGSAPGWGSLGRLKISGKLLEERPGFSSKTLEKVKITPGQARRHVTAWHNIRLYLNTLISRDEANFFSKLEAILNKKQYSPDMYEEGSRLVDLLPDSRFGNFVGQEGQHLILSAFLMNSKIQNLWPGEGRENSEIATFSAWLQSQFNGYQSGSLGGNYQNFVFNLTNYNLSSVLAKSVRSQMVEYLNKSKLGLKSAAFKTEFYKIIKPLEVDYVEGDRKETLALDMHDRIYSMLYQDAALDWSQDEEVLDYFISA